MKLDFHHGGARDQIVADVHSLTAACPTPNPTDADDGMSRHAELSI